MARGPLFDADYKPQFSGHETFPLRHGWLKKVFDAIQKTENDAENKSVFTHSNAIAYFGVGKNMVASMRYWASATNIIKEGPSSSVIHTGELGRKLLGKDGLDPYLEHPASLWLLHWKLASRHTKTTWFWVYNHFPAASFDRDQLISGLMRLAKERSWSRVADKTLRNDVACFLRTYARQHDSSRASNEDALESPLTELGLIKDIGGRHHHHFVRGPKPSLGKGVFIYALNDFWDHRASGTSTLSLEAIAHEPGSPGRVFLLHEDDVANYLTDLNQATKGKLRWSETAGLKQVIRNTGSKDSDHLAFVEMDYAH